jgi:hypothetical protein
MAAAFSSAWATVRKPGMGTVLVLLAQIQARAPWARVAVAGGDVADGFDAAEPLRSRPPVGRVEAQPGG